MKTFEDIKSKLANDTIWERDELVSAANVLLRHHAPHVPLVTNAGDALLVLALSKAGEDINYTQHERRFHDLESGSSYCSLPSLGVGIVANRRGCVEIIAGSMDIDELLLTAREIFLQHPMNRVKLSGHGVPAIVDDHEVESLTRAEYEVVRALLLAGSQGLSGRQLVKNSGHTDAVNVLKRLSKRPKWRTVIKIPDRPYGGYALLFLS